MLVRDAIIDGEVVVEATGGSPDFSALQDVLAIGRTDRLVFYAFDHSISMVMSLRAVPLIERRAALQEINTAPGNARYSEHFEENGGLVFRHACRLGLVGVVSKLCQPAA